MPRKPDERIEKAMKLYFSGKKLIEISKELKVPEGTVRSWKNRYKWDCNVAKRKCNVAEGTKQKKAPVTDEVKDVIENDNLTDKQRLFCIYYVRCFNATKAYQKAYGVGYATAASISYRLLENDGVRNEINRLKRNRFNRELLSEEDIVQRYIDIAHSDIKDYIEIKDGTVCLKNSDEFDGMLVKKATSGKINSIELYDSMKALQWLSDHMDLATTEQKIRIEKLKEEKDIDTKTNTEVQIYLPDNGRNSVE